MTEGHVSGSNLERDNDGNVVVMKGLPVKGYGDQTQDKVSLVNFNKEKEEEILRLLDTLAQLEHVDKRWLAIGRTAIENGFMAVNRSIFKPGRVALPNDKVT